MFEAHTVRVQRDPVMRLCVLRARARGVSAVVCVGAPLRARVTHEITHLDGRVVRGAPRELRALSNSRCCRCEHLLRAKESHDAFGRALEARMWSVSVVVGVGMPLRARTVLEMCGIWMGEWGGAPESCARYLRCCCEHLLCAIGILCCVCACSSTCVERSCGCMRGHTTPSPCNARDGAF